MTPGGVLRSALFPLTVVAGFVVGVVALAAFAPLLGFDRVVVVSGSMAPAVSVGDVVVLRERSSSPLRPGAVVTFRDPALAGRLVTHRLVETLPDGRYRTRGDANLLPDSTPVSPDDVVGVAVAVVPRVGRPLLWVQAAPWRGPLVAIAGFVVIGAYGALGRFGAFSRFGRFGAFSRFGAAQAVSRPRAPRVGSGTARRVVVVRPGDDVSRRPW